MVFIPGSASQILSIRKTKLKENIGFHEFLPIDLTKWTSSRLESN